MTAAVAETTVAIIATTNNGIDSTRPTCLRGPSPRLIAMVITTPNATNVATRMFMIVVRSENSAGPSHCGGELNGARAAATVTMIALSAIIDTTTVSATIK